MKTESNHSPLTATAAGVCRWMIQRMSGRAWWMAECKVKLALLMPSPVDPVSTISPRTSTLTSVLAVISEYTMPNGLTRNCSCSWLSLAWNTVFKHLWMQTEFLMHLWLKKKLKFNMQNQTIMTEWHTQTVCASSSFTFSLVAQGAVLSYGEKNFPGG